MARMLDPVELAAGLGMRCDAWQKDVLRTDDKRILLNCSRQSGKSTICAVKAVHRAVYFPGSLVLMVSPTLRQSGLLFRAALAQYRMLGRPVKSVEENQLSLVLENGSSIVSLPGSENTIRGFSAVDLLLIDEAAQVEDDVFTAVSPMLAISDGQLIALSTPWGQRGWWYEAWRGREQWMRVEIPATACPRIKPKFLEEMRRTLGSWRYAQEFECRFTESDEAAFRVEDIEALIDPEMEAWTWLDITSLRP
jgi:hypothetical protein